ERALLRGERATPPETVTYAPVGRVSTASPERPRRQPMSGARRRAVRPQVSRYRAGYVGRRRRAGALDLRQPVPVCRALASRDAEVEVVDLPDQRPHLPVAHGDAVDGADRDDLPAATAEKRLVTHVQLSPVDVPLLDAEIQLLGKELEQGLARDALQDVT